MTIFKKLSVAAIAIVGITWMLPTACLAVKIGIVWMGESSMTERIEKGFIEAFPKLAPDADIERHHIEDIQGYEALEKTVRRFEKEKDGMLVLRSNGAKWLSENRTSIPTFIGATNNPAVIGAVKNLDAPEGNVTGVTYYLPHKTQFEVFKLLIPDMKSILLLLQKGHASTLVDRRGTRKACRELGIEYNEVESASIDDSISAIKAHKDKISAVIIGTNNINIERTPAIVEAAGDIPVLAYTDKPVKNGALAGLVPNDAKRARLLAESVYDVLVNKKPIKEVPVKFDPDPKFLINPAAAERYSVNVTYEVLKFATILE